MMRLNFSKNGTYKAPLKKLINNFDEAPCKYVLIGSIAIRLALPASIKYLSVPTNDLDFYVEESEYEESFIPPQLKLVHNILVDSFIEPSSRCSFDFLPVDFDAGLEGYIYDKATTKILNGISIRTASLNSLLILLLDSTQQRHKERIELIFKHHNYLIENLKNEIKKEILPYYPHYEYLMKELDGYQGK